MAGPNQTTLKTKLFHLLVISVGVIFNAIGSGIFILPNNFLCGGATGYGRVLAELLNVPVSYCTGAITVALFFVGLFTLGKEFASTILIGTFLYPAGLRFLELFPALQNFTQDKLLAAAFAALFIGAGVGMVIRVGGSTGGSDVLAVVLNRKKGLSAALVVNVVDITALLLQCSFATTDEILYGILIILAYSMVMNKVLMMGSNDAEFIIVSKKWQQMRDGLLKDANVGSTLLQGEGGYLHEPNPVLLCTAQKRRIHAVKQVIADIDPLAFVTVLPASDVSGRGFSLSRTYGLDTENRTII
jgi:uncharacterized membrane-anchored protein YitT (DUF2179 family)